MPRRVNKSDVNMWGVGAVQEIDAAAMSMWISYRHFDGSFTATDTDDGTSAKFKLEPFQLGKFGALINF